MYIGQWHLSPLQSRQFGISHSSPNSHQLTHRIFLNFINSLNFSFGESQKSQGTKSGLQGAWVIWVIWCFTKKLCTRRDVWVGVLLWWSCQSLVAYSCGLLNIFHRGMFKLLVKFDADSLLYSLILNMMATQYTCSFNDSFHPHWLVQWSHHGSYMGIPVHSPWLPGYIDVWQLFSLY